MKTHVMWYSHRNGLVSPIEVVDAVAFRIRDKFYWMGVDGKAYRTDTLAYNPHAALFRSRQTLQKAMHNPRVPPDRVAQLAKNVAHMERVYS